MDGKILLVDDEKDIVDLMEEVLRQDGFLFIKKAYTGMEWFWILCCQIVTA